MKCALHLPIPTSPSLCNSFSTCFYSRCRDLDSIASTWTFVTNLIIVRADHVLALNGRCLLSYPSLQPRLGWRISYYQVMLDPLHNTHATKSERNTTVSDNGLRTPPSAAYQLKFGRPIWRDFSSKPQEALDYPPSSRIFHCLKSRKSKNPIPCLWYCIWSLIIMLKSTEQYSSYSECLSFCPSRSPDSGKPQNPVLSAALREDLGQIIVLVQ